MANLCQHMHVLPQTGGMLDQDCMFVVTLNWIVTAQETKRELEQQEIERRTRSQSIAR